jgi:fatty acid desaturase
MSLLPRLRRAPWVSGAVLLALAAGLTAPVAYALGVRRWPLVVGLAAVLLLLFGGVERLWQRRPLPRPRRTAARLRFRVVPGGKGNGRPRDSDTTDDDGEKPRWLM